MTTEKERVIKITAEDQGDMIIDGIVENLKALCNLAIKKGYNATSYQYRKLDEMKNYVNSLQKYFDF